MHYNNSTSRSRQKTTCISSCPVIISVCRLGISVNLDLLDKHILNAWVSWVSECQKCCKFYIEILEVSEGSSREMINNYP